MDVIVEAFRGSDSAKYQDADLKEDCGHVQRLSEVDLYEAIESKREELGNRGR
jgi:hypothetical protein